MGELYQELKRRNIFRVGMAYLVLSWLLLQVGSVLAPILDVPEGVLSVVVFLLLLGFPLALLLAWAFELTPEGLKRSSEVSLKTSVSDATGRRLNGVIIGVLVLAVITLLADRFYFSDPSGPGLVSDAGLDVPLGERIYESIAVLPFVNMSEDASQEFFSDGISEELLNLLAKTRGLRVAARTSSFAFKGKNQDIKGIGEQLNVETVLEGSVRKADSRLRITAQLIDVQSGYHLWSETFDRELVDVFAIQDEISAAIVEALAVHFDGVAAPSPVSIRGDVQAYEHYLKGRELIGLRTEDYINEALDHFTAAVKIDPAYAPAWSGKADAYMLLQDDSYGDLPLKYLEDLVGPLVERALSLDPLSADAHNSKAFFLNQLGRNEEAIASFDRALELRPSFAMAWMWKGLTLFDLGRARQSWEAQEKAHRIDPLSLVVAINVVNMRVIFGEHESALALARSMEEHSPQRPDRYGSAYFRIYDDQGDFSSAHQLFIRFGEKGWQDERYAFFNARNYMRMGDVSEAVKISDVLDGVQILARIWQCDAAADLLGNLSPVALVKQEAIGARIAVGFCRGDLQMADQALSELKDFDTSIEGPLYNDEPDRIGGIDLLQIVQASGDLDRIASVEADIKAYQERFAEDVALGYGWFLKARLKMLKGDHDGAIADLERAGQNNRLYWFDRYDPALAAVAERAEFKAVFDKVDAHVNAERAELGWGPMEIDP